MCDLSYFRRGYVVHIVTSLELIGLRICLNLRYLHLDVLINCLAQLLELRNVVLQSILQNRQIDMV